MREWFRKHHFEGLDELWFAIHKPPAVIYIDDRAFRFEGTFPTIEEIASFVPWNKRLSTLNPQPSTLPA